MNRLIVFLAALFAVTPAMAVKVAVFPTGDAAIDLALQRAASGRTEVESIPLAQVREEMNATTVAGIDCALPTVECLIPLGAALGAEWVLVPRQSTSEDLKIGLFDLATQLELLTTDAKIGGGGDQVKVFDRALGRLFNPEADGGIEVQTDPQNQVWLDDDTASRLGPKVVFKNVAPGEHIIRVRAPDGRTERVTITVNGNSVTSASISLPERSRPLLMTGAITLSTGVAVMVIGGLVAGGMQALINPLFFGSISDRETFRTIGLAGIGIIGLGAIPAVAGGVMTGVGALVE